MILQMTKLHMTMKLLIVRNTRTAHMEMIVYLITTE